MVGAGVWTGEQLNIVSVGSIDLCSFGGVQLAGYVEGNSVVYKVWKAAEYQEYDVLEDSELRDGIKSFSNWPTIPQLYVNGEFIGGSDIVYDMYKEGTIEEALK